jgi:sarcosine oxidase
MDADVVVVGAGLLGLACARALARRGHEVIVFDQAQVGHEAGGSKGSCRIFRLGYDDAWWVSLAMRARAHWAELEDECGRRLLQPTPHLTFGPRLDAVRAAMLKAGAPHEMLPADAAAQRFPQIAADGPALVEPQSAVIAADAALRALAAAVPDLRTGVRVTGLADDGRQVTASTDAGSVTARTAVVCAGPWTGALLAGSGIAVPSTATLEQVGYLAPAADPGPAMPIFIGHGTPEPYGLPVPGSPLYKIGFHHSGPVVDPGRQDQGPDPDLIARLVSLARRHVPSLPPEIVATERCVYDNSPDEDFVVDRVGNIVIGSGTSGHGFKFGPMLGEWLADLASGGQADGGTGRAADPAARRLSLARLGATVGPH